MDIKYIQGWRYPSPIYFYYFTEMISKSLRAQVINITFLIFSKSFCHDCSLFVSCSIELANLLSLGSNSLERRRLNWTSRVFLRVWYSFWSSFFCWSAIFSESSNADMHFMPFCFDEVEIRFFYSMKALKILWRVIGLVFIITKN